MSARGDFIDFRRGDLLVGRPGRPTGIIYLESRARMRRDIPYRDHHFDLEKSVILALASFRPGPGAVFEDCPVLLSDGERGRMYFGWIPNLTLVRDCWLA